MTSDKTIYFQRLIDIVSTLAQYLICAQIGDELSFEKEVIFELFKRSPISSSKEDSAYYYSTVVASSLNELDKAELLLRNNKMLDPFK